VPTLHEQRDELARQMQAIQQAIADAEAPIRAAEAKFLFRVEQALKGRALHGAAMVDVAFIALAVLDVLGVSHGAIDADRPAAAKQA